MSPQIVGVGNLVWSVRLLLLLAGDFVAPSLALGVAFSCRNAGMDHYPKVYFYNNKKKNLLSPSFWGGRSFVLGATRSSSRITRNNSGNRTGQDEDQHGRLVVGTTLEYSPNFRRHIVRQNGTVVQSFAWMDEALLAFPHAQRLPLFESSQGHVLPVAGAGVTPVDSSSAYPIQDPLAGDATQAAANQAALHHYLQTTLGWYDSQVTQFCHACPFVTEWPVQYLRERINFLLAPLPSTTEDEQDNVLANVQAATALDWPVQFYRHGRGAGLSVAQLAHALSVVPQLLFADYQNVVVKRTSSTPNTTTSTMTITAINTTTAAPNQIDSEKLRRARYVYQETPAVVLPLARQQVDALYGASATDAAAYSYLHWKGWEFDQIRVVLQALPGTVRCATETSWELLDRRGGTRSTLRPEALLYLQYRLQISPSHWQALLKTHTALSYYRVTLLQRSCDALQTKLQLSSNELRSLVLRMPSVLGMSVTALEERIVFWTETVGLSAEQLRHVVGSHPSLLQYGVTSNLQPKWHLFHDELNLSQACVRNITLNHTQLWGRSLDKHWRPLCQLFCDACGEQMTMPVWGTVLSRVPELATCHWKRTLQVKLDFLANRLDLTPDDLHSIVTRTPRVLMKSIPSYLRPNMDLLEDRSSRAQARQAILDNPALLLTPHATLVKRLQRAEVMSASSASNDASATEKGTLAQALTVTKQSRRRSTRVVHLMAEGTSSSSSSVVQQTFASVAEAAAHAQVSKPHMYLVLRQGRLVGGKRYVMAEKKDDSDNDPMESSPTVATQAPNATSTTLSGSATRLDPPPAPPNRLIIYTAARAFPPEDRLRGRRRAGGMALQVPTWSVQDWKRVVPRLWKGQRYKLLSDGRTLLLGYAYTRPSRTRCSLYACKEALRAVEVWIHETADELASLSVPLEIEVVTDSNRCLEYLEDSRLLETWANTTTTTTETKGQFSPPIPVNSDIFQPLALTYTKLLQEPVADEDHVARRVESVVFRKEVNSRLGQGAQLAAKLMYDSMSALTNLPV